MLQSKRLMNATENGQGKMVDMYRLVHFSSFQREKVNNVHHDHIDINVMRN